MEQIIVEGLEVFGYLQYMTGKRGRTDLCRELLD